MSRIGKLPIPVLDKATVKIDGQTVRVEGPKGKLEKTFDRSVNIELSDSEIRVTPADKSPHAYAMYGTVRSIINNMVVGVVEGYKKELELKGVGFRGALKGDVLDMALGKSHPCEIKIPEASRLLLRKIRKSPSKVRTSSWSVKSPPRSSPSTRPSLTRAKAFTLSASMSAARRAKSPLKHFS